MWGVYEEGARERVRGERGEAGGREGMQCVQQAASSSAIGKRRAMLPYEVEVRVLTPAKQARMLAWQPAQHA